MTDLGLATTEILLIVGFTAFVLGFLAYRGEWFVRVA